MRCAVLALVFALGCGHPRSNPRAGDAGVATDLGVGTDGAAAEDEGVIAADGSAADGASADGGSELEPVSVVACDAIETRPTAVQASASGGFSPNVVTVTTGAVVRFTNLDAFTHTVTSINPEMLEPMMDGIFNETLPANGTLCLRFNTAGSYPFYCAIHTSMRGSVVVSNPTP
jgi:plastocyanin